MSRRSLGMLGHASIVTIHSTRHAQECQLRIGCSYFTFYNNSRMCWLMGATATLMDQPDPKATSGSKTCSSGVTPGAVITLPGDEAIGATLRDGFPTASTPALEASLEQIHHSHLK
eukprot:symbB.v1.2.000272.t1/scaffold20.1/size571870/17